MGCGASTNKEGEKVALEKAVASPGGGEGDTSIDSHHNEASQTDGASAAKKGRKEETPEEKTVPITRELERGGVAFAGACAWTEKQWLVGDGTEETPR
jgi:hypothetical protein